MILRRVDRVQIGDVVRHGPEVTWVVTKTVGSGDGRVALSMNVRVFPMVYDDDRILTLALMPDDLIEVVK